MPYKRTYRRRRAPARRKNTYVRKVARTEAKKAVARQVETKRLDNLWASQAVDYSTGIVLSMTNGIGQGVGESDFIGTKVHPAGIRIRLQYGRSDASQLLRFIVIQNKAGGVPLLNTLLASVGNITAPLSNYDTSYNDTYRVLYDRLISMDSIRGSTGALSIAFPAKKLRQITFTGATGTPEKGGIYFCAISDSAAAAHPVVDLRSSFYFKDA